MAIDNRIGNKVIKNARREGATGTRVDPYPYVGIVKNNLDPTRSGRLQVFIPDLGGPPDDPNNWRTVSYASPFMGYTSQVQNSTDRPSTANRFDNVRHTYGMWMVPPDVGVEVIVIFIAGDPLRGYFIACVNSNLSHYMMPGLAGTPNVDPDSLTTAERKTYSKGDVVPVVEFNEYTKDFTNAAFYNNNKPLHTYQYNILKNQGLEKDVIRGAISSSSQRESPSTVFGISTPGRPLNDPADDINYTEKLNSGKLPADYFKVKSRKGGHVFVMDDGAALGEDQLVRLRSSSGHQILLHDTNNLLYIAHADGDCWIELGTNGDLSVYAAGGINLRSNSDINIHSDENVNINAKGAVNIRSGEKVKVESLKTEISSTGLKFESAGATEFKVGGAFRVQADAKISLKAGGIFAVDAAGVFQQSKSSDSVQPVTPMVLNSLPDTTFNSALGQWKIKSSALSTIVTTAPSHEPYSRGKTGIFFKPTSPGIQPATTYQGDVDAIKQPATTDAGVQNPAGEKDIRNQPDASAELGGLSKEQMTAYYAQIGKSESGGDYSVVNSIGYVGKYQFGYPALIDTGYVKSSCKSNAQLKNPNNWTGKGGISSLDDWLANKAEQESAMEELTKRNYTTMCKIGAIDKTMPPEDVAGMLAVSHLLGPGGAKKYRNGESGADAYGTTGGTYFNKGKYAVAQLAPKVPEINAG